MLTEGVPDRWYVDERRQSDGLYSNRTHE